MSETHAALSPSGADRWMECAGSLALGHGLTDRSSEYADDGTASHTLAAWCLMDGSNCADRIGTVIPAGTRQFTVDAERAEFTQLYVDAVRQRITEYELAGAISVELFVEQRVPIDHLTGEPGAGGTSDAIIVVQWADGTGLIDCWDLKYGRGVEVVAHQNRQGQMYTLGALRKFDLLGNITRARINIHQPRIRREPSEYEVTLVELEAFAAEVKSSASTAHIAFEHRANWIGKSNAYLNPGEKQCMFCKAKASCPALDQFVQDSVGADFADLTNPAEISNAKELVPAEPFELSQKMAAIGLIEDWCKAIRAEVERCLLAGVAVDGYKLVEGKLGNRLWTDEQAAEDLLRKQFRLSIEQAYNLKLISPTDAEKLLAKESPKRWTKLQPLISRNPGKPSVAPASDKRPALVVTPTADDFEDITEVAEDLV